MEFDGKEEALAKDAKRSTKARAPRTKKAAEAARAEALAEGVKFEYDGESYQIDPAIEWDLDVFEFIGSGDVLKAVKTLLGDEQWETFRTVDDGKGGRVKTKRTLSHLNDLWATVEDVIGTEPGE